VRGFLALEDGTLFEGESFGAGGKKAGEIVFNTSMAGYQEILTDPSYRGQIVSMTYPLIGNYGVNPEDVESSRPRVEGFAVREYCDYPDNWRSRGTLADYLRESGVVAISEIDTRALTKHIRTAGAMRAVIAAGDCSPEELVREAREFPGLVGRDLVREVTCASAYRWEGEAGPKRFKVVAYDFGMKYNIARMLSRRGCDVRVVPAATSAREALSGDPDGVFLSNGPGDPAGVPHIVEEMRKLLDKKPIFGICFGHQILGLAFGARTFKLKFGHRGANQPVKDLATGKVQITAQNHGFCVDAGALGGAGVELTHVNLNDGTLEGMRHRELPIFSVQYHPEASPGPHDAGYLFGSFVELMQGRKKR